VPAGAAGTDALLDASAVDDHRIKGLVNGFIAGKQDALFEAQQAEPASARAGFTRWETLSRPTVTRGTLYRTHSVAAGNQYATDGSQAPVGSL
jgi:hypothetical protein